MTFPHDYFCCNKFLREEINLTFLMGRKIISLGFPIYGSIYFFVVVLRQFPHHNDITASIFQFYLKGLKKFLINNPEGIYISVKDILETANFIFVHLLGFRISFDTLNSAKCIYFNNVKTLLEPSIVVVVVVVVDTDHQSVRFSRNMRWWGSNLVH